MSCRVAATIPNPTQRPTRKTGMNWKSGCGWFLAVYLFVAVILTAFGVQPAVAIWLCLAITGLLAYLYHWWGKEALRSPREKPAPAPLQSQPRVRRSSRRRTSARTTRQSPRSHTRRGHWHDYWTGPRDDPEKRTKIKRWVDSIHVGGFRELTLASRFKLEWIGTGSRHIYRWLQCKIRDKHYWQQVGNIGWVDYETGRRTGAFVCCICGKEEFRR